MIDYHDFMTVFERIESFKNKIDIGHTVNFGIVSDVIFFNFWCKMDMLRWKLFHGSNYHIGFNICYYGGPFCVIDLSNDNDRYYFYAL